MSEIEYTIAAIPTLYNGRQYRSRLEAKWAAFYDLYGLKAEYEPYDLGIWSPDFLYVTPAGVSVLVEVKPISEAHMPTLHKMWSAAASSNFHGVLLLVGNGPARCPYGVISVGYAMEMIPPADVMPNRAFFYAARKEDASSMLSVWNRACNAVQWHCP